MDIRVNTKDGIPIYSQIVSQIKYLVASGRLAESEQLPPVRKLAETLMVNPNTVARAYRELELEKIISTRRGSGVYVDATSSPLARKEKIRLLQEKIDALLAEANMLQVDDTTLNQLIEKRRQLLRSNSGGPNDR